MNLIEFKNVSKSYGTFQALKNINLQIEPGKIYGLLGPNGSGKTTIIKLINDLLTPTEGSILIKGQKPGVDSKKIISYLPERTYLNTNSKVSEIISLFEDFYEDFNKDKALKLLNDLNIDKDGDGKIDVDLQGEETHKNGDKVKTDDDALVVEFTALAFVSLAIMVLISYKKKLG